MGFFLFILVNAVLFIRPVEAFGIHDLENSYLVLIVPCIYLSLNSILSCLLGKPLNAQPVAMCVFAIAHDRAAFVCRQVRSQQCLPHCTDFSKIVIYFLLLISLVNSPGRLKVFLAFILIFCAVLTGHSILCNLKIIRLASVKVLPGEKPDPITGEHAGARPAGRGRPVPGSQRNVRHAGRSHPARRFYFLSNRSNLFSQLLGLLTTPLFLTGIIMTRSHGGFLALLAGLGVDVVHTLGAQENVSGWAASD